jgi:hypothetical protein
MMRVACLLSAAFSARAAFWAEVSPQINQSVTAPAPRTGALAFSLNDGSIVVHGGCSSSCCYAPLGDAWRWSPSSAWTNVTAATSAAPQGRLYHSGSPALNGFYLFGGSNVQTGVLNDLWHLQVPASGPIAWEKLSSTAPIGARAGQSQVPIRDTSGRFEGSFLVFGGINLTDVQSDLWMYNATTARWTLLDAGKPKVGPGAPGPRSQHDALVVTSSSGTRWMIIAGGSDDLGNDQSDVWAFNLETSKWSCLGAGASASASSSFSSSWPVGRHGHSIWTASASSTADGDVVQFYLFGGQQGTLSDSPFLGDLWQFKAVLPSDSEASLAGACSGTGSFTLLQSGTTVPTAGQPVARALGGKGLYYAPYTGAVSSSAASSGTADAAPAPVLYFGGFSGYQGGTNDLLHNDLWSFTPPQ